MAKKHYDSDAKKLLTVGRVVDRIIELRTMLWTLEKKLKKLEGLNLPNNPPQDK